jgi:hypothetical protein
MSFLCHTLCHDVMLHHRPKGNGTSQSWNETSKSWSQNIPFLDESQVFVIVMNSWGWQRPCRQSVLFKARSISLWSSVDTMTEWPDSCCSVSEPVLLQVLYENLLKFSFSARQDQALNVLWVLVLGSVWTWRKVTSFIRLPHVTLSFPENWQ